MRNIRSSNRKIADHLETAVQAYSSLMLAIYRGHRHSHLLTQFVQTLESLPFFDEGVWNRVHAFASRDRRGMKAHELRYDLRLLFIDVAAHIRREWAIG